MRIRRRAVAAAGGDELVATAPGKRSRTEGLVAQAGDDHGAPLDEGVRARFEGSLGVDLGGVRVHTGGPAAASAAALGARAYASGDDIHFGAGEYRPDDPYGLHLLAHEVAHTVQQDGAPAPRCKLEVGAVHDPAEVEADAAADAMIDGRWFHIGATAQGVNRKPVETPPGPSSLERDERATDSSDMARDAADQVVMMATSALHERRAAVLAACPEEYASIAAPLRLLLDPMLRPDERQQALAAVRAALRRPMQLVALEDGGGELVQRLEQLLAEEDAVLLRLGQRHRVDQSAWVDGQLVDVADGDSADVAVEALYATFAALREAAAAAGMGEVFAERFTPQSVSRERGVTKVSLAVSALQLATSQLFELLAEKALDRNLPGIVDAMKLAGNKLNGTIGGLAAAFGVARGAIDLFSSESSTMARVDGAVAVGTGSMQLVGAGGMLAGASWGAALSGAGTFLSFTYHYAKLLISTIEAGVEARIGLVRATINSKLDVVQRRAAGLLAVLDKMERAHALAAGEADPAKRRELERYQDELADEGAGIIDDFIDDLHGPDRPHMRYAWSLDEPTMQGLFAPLMARRGLRGRDAVLQSMQIMLEQLAYAVTHGRELAFEMTTRDAPE